MSDGDVIATGPISPCDACGKSEWADDAEGSDMRCASCGTIYTIEDRPTRELRGDEWHSIHRHVRVSLDGLHETPLITFDMGRDDQRPDPDPALGIFKPVCVAQMLSGGGDSVYTYHWYCGACRKRIGSLGEIKEFCPRCGKAIAHYVFADGVEQYRRDGWDGPSMPDVWPESP